MTPYYADELATLYLADCRDCEAWLHADVMLTDPPYGRGWQQGRLSPDHRKSDRHRGIAGDRDTSLRDRVLADWGRRPAVVFGDLMLPPPAGTVQVLVYRKPINSGLRGAMGGYRRDAEAIYLVGPWPSGLGGRSSVIPTRLLVAGGPASPAMKFGHPHAKPLDVLAALVAHLPPGVIADPFAGSGSIMVAAKAAGRRVVGVEIEERFAESAAKRLAQDVLPFDVDTRMGDELADEQLLLAGDMEAS